MHSHTVIATNFATTSENAIHHDDVAQRYGFRGGLVPGVAVYAYMTNPIVAVHGRAWLERGAAEVRFGSPVYDGDKVTTSIDDAGGLSLVDSAGETCATGTAWAVGAAVDAPAIPAQPLPASRPPASVESLAPGTVLGAVEHHFHANAARAYLDSIGEDLPLYRSEGVAHPGWLLLDANNVLAGSVKLPPWIHVGSHVTNLAAVTDGQLISTRARVTANYERKGHHFVDLDVVITADGAPATVVRHKAIWQVRPVASEA